MQALQAYIRFCRRFAWQVVAAVALLSAVALYFAVQLRVQADMARLLPDDAPSVAGLERLERVYGGQIGRLTVVLQADRPPPTTAKHRNPHLERLADRLAVGLGHLDGVRRVEARRPLEFFEAHRLLYADYGDLEQAKRRIERRITWEKKRANPLFVGLDDSPPPAVDLTDLTDKYQDLSRAPYYVSADGRTLALFIYPSFPAADLEQARVLVDRVDRVVTNELAGQSDVGYGLTGRYKKRVDLQTMIQHDLTLSMSLALGLLLLFLFAFLRSVRGTLVVLAPLVVGTIWTFAWAALTFGSLNILTAFLGAVLLGLGVDYGIHLYSRFQELREEFEPGRALYETLASTGRANFFAALTTMVALGSLLVSRFRAFFEFGVTSLGGLLLILVAYLLLFPCMMILAERYHLDLPAPASQALTRRVVAWLSAPGQRGRTSRIRKLGRAAQAVLLTLVLAAAVGLPHVRFVRDFAVVQSTSAPSWKLDERVNALLGQSQTPAVVLTDSPAQSARVVAELRRRQAHQPQGYTIDKVVSLQTFVPEKQSAKLDLLEGVAAALRGLPESLRNKKLGNYLREITRVVKNGPVNAAELPVEVRQPFSRRDSPEKSVVLVFPSITLSDMDEVDDFATVLRDLPGVDPAQGYDAISDALLLRDIICLVERDSIWMLAITLAGLILLSIVAFRDRVLVMLQLAVLALSVLVALGMLGLFGVDFNFMNVVVLPIWVGLGVDASFHVLMHVENGHRLEPHSNVALAITAAYLTSMIGFGTLLLARHNGLMSLGQVAVVGLGSILAINLLVQVVLVAGQRRNHDARAKT